MDYEARPRTRLWEPLLVLAGFVIVVLYAVTAFSSEDLMWFWPQSMMPEPSKIVVHKAGRELVFEPGASGFDLLAQASMEAFSQLDVPSLIEIGLSEVTLERYWTQFTVVEFFYDEELDFHVPFQAGNPTQLLFPIEGTHSGRGWFFRGAHGEYWFGAMRVEKPQLIIDAVAPFLE